MNRLLEALADVVTGAFALAARTIEKHDEFLVEIGVVLTVYFSVAIILFHYQKTAEGVTWLTGGALITVVVQAFRNRLGGGDETTKKPEEPAKKENA